MSEYRKIDKRQSLRVVTDNDFITTSELTELSLNARKLLYIAISQCKKSDSKFYEYETTPKELAEMWGIDESNVYQAADKITDELMNILIKKTTDKPKEFDKKHLFEKCSYHSHIVSFKLHAEMRDHFLGLNGDFSKPLVWDFMKMKSPYTMAIWHLMQKEMKSFKPGFSAPIEFEISVDELRAITGTQNKLKQIGQFKERVLDKALAEIEKNCFTKITYTNVKDGHTITAFNFTAESLLGGIDPEKLPIRDRKRARKALLVYKRSIERISEEELKELDRLEKELEQITIPDFLSGQTD